MLRREHREERGAVLIISTVGMVLAVICAALAIDIGRTVQDERQMQKIADLAALDAVRALDDPLAATGGLVYALAADSARRNGYEPADTRHTFIVDVGRFVNRAFVKYATVTSGSSALVGYSGSSVNDAVRVTAKDRLDYLIQPGDGHTKGVGVASKTGVVDFSVGSSLAQLTLDATGNSHALLLNRTLRSLFGNATAANLTAVSYNGLITGGLTLGSLQDELAAVGYEFGTTDELLNSDIVVRDLFIASAEALRNDGQVASAQAFDTMIAQMNSSRTVRLSDMAVVDTGNGSVLDSSINAFELVTGTAMVMNGGSIVNIPNLNIGNVQSISMNIGEGRRFCWRCPVGRGVETQQVATDLTTVIQLPLGLLGSLINATITTRITAADGSGTVAGVENCGVPGQRALIAAHSNASTVSMRISVSILNNVQILNVPLGQGNGTLSYDYTADFSPIVGNSPGQEVGVSTINLGNATLPGLLTPFANLINNTISNIATAVIGPLRELLGLQIGIAQIQALDMDCAQPKLVA